MTPQDNESKRSFRARYLSGLKTSVLNNTVAYGYSITITASYGVLNFMEDTPNLWNIIGFVCGAVLAFTMVEVFVYVGFRHELVEEPIEVVVLGSAFSFLSIGLALAATLCVGWLLNGPTGWLVGAFLATIVYIGFLALEMSVADHLRSH
jgi:hypothetical protein